MVRRKNQLTEKDLKAFEESPFFTNTLKQIEAIHNVARQAFDPIQPVLKRMQGQIKDLNLGQKNNNSYLVDDDFAPFLFTNKIEDKNDTSLKEYSLIYNKQESIIYRKIEGKLFESPIKKNSIRMKLFEKLLEKEYTYISTEDLFEIVGSKNSDSFRKMIGTFNSVLSHDLKINSKVKLKIIQGRSSYGYRLNPLIHISKV